MTLASALIKAAIIGLALDCASASPQEVAACAATAGSAPLEFDNEEGLVMLQRRARVMSQGPGEEAAPALSQGAREDEGPLQEMLRKMQEQQQQAQQAQQQAQQQEQQEQEQLSGDEQKDEDEMQNEPEVLQKVNAILRKKVTAKLNQMLPSMIKAKGMDPVPNLLSKQNLNVKNLEGLSRINVTTFFMKSLNLGLNASGFGGHAVFLLRAEIPGTRAQISRQGMFGKAQNYQLSMNGITVTVKLVGGAKLHGTKLIADSMEPHVQVLIKQVGVNGQGPRFIVSKLNSAVTQHQQSLQEKMARKLHESLSRVFSKMLPMPLDLELKEQKSSKTNSRSPWPWSSNLEVGEDDEDH